MFKMTSSSPLQVIDSKEITADKSKLLCQSRFIAKFLLARKIENSFNYPIIKEYIIFLQIHEMKFIIVKKRYIAVSNP